MSRTLSRPMFRLGGSTSGITSGLDTPKRGRVDGPGGYAGLGKLDPEEAMRITETITDKYYPQRGADLSRFLINFGLNMAGNPPSGNIIQTAAKQAQQPTSALYEDIDRSRLMKQQAGASIFGDVLGAQADIIAGEGKGYLEGFKIEKVNEFIERIYNNKKKIKGLDPTADAEDIAEIELQIRKDQANLDNLTSDEVIRAKLGMKDLQEKHIKSIMNDLLEEDQKLAEGERKYKKDEMSPNLYQDAFAEWESIIRQRGATGGRVGYQGGELVEDVNVQETVTAPGVGVGAPQVDPVGISYNELRARLPESIGDDIVLLISQSNAALEDFATIQTQQDVDNFNTKYNVNLVLPAEA
jgi:hypothetical protein